MAQKEPISSISTPEAPLMCRYHRVPMSKISHSIAMDAPRHPGATEILKEAISIACRNTKLMACALFLAFLPSFLLFMGNCVSIYPFLLNFIIKLHLLNDKDPITPQFYDIILRIKEDAEAFLQVDMLFAVASYMLSFFFMVSIIHASAVTYAGKQSTLGDMSSRIQQVWKGALVTRLYSTLLYVGYTVMSVSFIGVLMLNAKGSVGFLALGALLGLAARLLYVYLAMIWTVGVVISVVEDGCYGLEAFGRAEQLVKGRRVQGFMLAAALLVMDVVLTGGYGVGAAEAAQSLKAAAPGLMMENILFLLKVFSFMVYTVYYYECKKTHQREEEESWSFMYGTSMPLVTPNADEDLP